MKNVFKINLFITDKGNTFEVNDAELTEVAIVASYGKKPPTSILSEQVLWNINKNGREIARQMDLSKDFTVTIKNAQLYGFK